MIERLGSKGKWVAILFIALLVGLGAKEAWDQGIITSVVRTAWFILVAIWQVLCDFAGACWEFWLYVLHQRS